MKHRLAMVLAAAAGLGAEARGQELIQVSYTWSEVIAGTLTPVALPNSVLEPGEGARIGINVFATINGTNAVGQTTTYTAPPPPGFGTVRGVAVIMYNLYGDLGASTAAGSWNDRAISPYLPAGNFPGAIYTNGAVVDSFSGGQFVLPPQSCNATNPILDAFRGVWNPASYQACTVNFKAANGTAANFGQYAGVMVQYGTGYTDPADPTTAYPLYITKYLPNNYGAGINIPIIPASGTGLLLGGVAVNALRRRRRA